MRQLLADHAPEAYGGLTVPQLLDGLRAAFPGHQVLTDLERGEGADALEDEFPQMVAGLFGFRVQFLQHLTLPVGDGTQTGWVPGLVYGDTGPLLLIGYWPGHYIPLFVIDEDARTRLHPAAIGAPAAADQHAESARGRADHTADAEQLIQRWQRIVDEHEWRLRPLTLAERAAQRRPDTAAGRDELNRLNRYARPYQDALSSLTRLRRGQPINEFVRNARDQHDYLTGQVNRLETAAAGLDRNVAAARGVATPNFDEERNNTTPHNQAVVVNRYIGPDTTEVYLGRTGAERGELVEIPPHWPRGTLWFHLHQERTVVTDTHPYTGTGFARTIPLPVDDDVMQRARTEMGRHEPLGRLRPPPPPQHPHWIRPPVGGQGQPGGGLGGWSSQPGADAIPGPGTVSPRGELRVAGQPVHVGRTRGGVSTAGRVEYWFDQRRVWVRWPDGRRMEVLFRNQLSDGLWQRLRQAAVSGGPGRSGAVGIGGFAGAADAPTAAGRADPVSGSMGPFVEMFWPGGSLSGVRLFGGGGVWHVWVGLGPDGGLMDRLVVPAGTVVVHGHGVGGGLGSPAGVAEALGVARTGGWGEAREAVQALLLACEQTGAQAFATGHGIEVEATPESVFVSPHDGAVFFGQAEVGADGRLTVVTRVVPGALERFVPGGDGPVVRERPLVVGLSQEEVLAHPGPWQRRMRIGRWVAGVGALRLGAGPNVGRLLDGVPGPRQIGATILAGLVALAVAAPAATGSGRRRVAMVVRDRHEGLSELPGHGATDVVVGGFQFDVNTTYPNYGGPRHQ